MQGTDGILKKHKSCFFSAVSQKYEEQNADVKYSKSKGSAHFLNARKKFYFEIIYRVWSTCLTCVTAMWCY